MEGLISKMRNIHKSTPSSFRRRENAAAIVKAPPPGALTKGPDRKFPGLHPPPGGATSPSLSTNRRFAFPILALLAVLAVGLLFLLPGGPLQAQDADGPIMYAENGTGPVATYTAEDPEGTTITWTLEDEDNDADVFDIDEGVLTFKQSPNYEDPADADTDNVYNVTVVATDSGDEPEDVAMMTVTVMVTNVDEAGTLTLSTLQPVDGVDVTATLTDIDSVTDGNLPGTVDEDIAWKWAKSLNRAGAYTDIDGKIEATYKPTPDDLDHYLRATATYMDGQGSDKTEMAMSAHKVLAPRSTNTPPVFEDSDGVEIPNADSITREVAENSAAGYGCRRPRCGLRRPGRRADLHHWRHGHGVLRHRPGHGADHGGRRDHAGL